MTKSCQNKWIVIHVKVKSNTSQKRFKTRWGRKWQKWTTKYMQNFITITTSPQKVGKYLCKHRPAHLTVVSKEIYRAWGQLCLHILYLKLRTCCPLWIKIFVRCQGVAKARKIMSETSVELENNTLCRIRSHCNPVKKIKIQNILETAKE